MDSDQNVVSMNNDPTAMLEKGANALLSSAEANQQIFERFAEIMATQSAKHTAESERLSAKIEANTDCVRDMLKELTTQNVRMDHMSDSLNRMTEEQSLQRKQIHHAETRIVKLETSQSAVNDQNKGKWDMFFKTGTIVVTCAIAMISLVTMAIKSL